MPSPRISNFAPAEGATQKCSSFKGIKNLWRQRHRRSGSFPPRAHHARLGADHCSRGGVHQRFRRFIVTLPGRAGKKEHDMDSAERCRDQSAECLRLMKLTQSETEARVLRDIAQSWVRLANQIDRYTALAKSNGPHHANRRRIGVVPRSRI